MVASTSATVRPGRTTRAASASGPTGIGPSRSIANRPTTRPGSVIASIARPSRAAGGPPCWARSVHGPAVARVETKRSRPSSDEPSGT